MKAPGNLGIFYYKADLKGGKNSSQLKPQPMLGNDPPPRYWEAMLFHVLHRTNKSACKSNTRNGNIQKPVMDFKGRLCNVKPVKPAELQFFKKLSLVDSISTMESYHTTCVNWLTSARTSVFSTQQTSVNEPCSYGNYHYLYFLRFISF